MVPRHDSPLTVLDTVVIRQETVMASVPLRFTGMNVSNVIPFVVAAAAVQRAGRRQSPATRSSASMASISLVWSIESSFRNAEEELDMDHFRVCGWRCIHRHYYVTALSSLFCSRIRQR